MRNIRNVVYHVSQITAIALLAGSFGLANLWWGEFFVLAMLLVWWISSQAGWQWLPTALLMLYVSLAGVGLVTGADPFLLIAGSTSALVCWELSDKKLSNAPNHPLADLYERRYLKLLGITAGLGLLAAEAGLFLQFQLPFVVIFLVAGMVIFCLYKLLFFIRSPHNK
jgi:hypothetical protein